ncbi:MAG: TolB family protein [Terriglobales bacterium]
MAGRLGRGELVRYDVRSHQFVPFLSGISVGELDFSRDGKWVTYVSYPDYALWRSRVDGSDSLQLTFPPTSADLPRWSPDGTQIAFVDSELGRPLKIFLVSNQGGTWRCCRRPTTRLIRRGHPTGNNWLSVASGWSEAPKNWHSNL